MRHSGKALRAILVSLSLAGLAPLAAISHAQGLASVPMTMTPIYINNTIGLVGIDAARQANRIAYPQRLAPGRRPPVIAPQPATPRRTAPRATSWTVGANAAASAEVRTQFFNLVRRNYAPNVASSIIATYTRKPVRSAFLEVARPAGLNSNDFRDVATAYFICGWMIANQAPTPSNAQIAGVRAQVAAAMASAPPAYDDRARQVAAEQMMYEITAMIYARQEGEGGRDPAGLARMADAAAAAYRKQGLDLRRVVLADRGFAVR